MLNHARVKRGAADMIGLLCACELMITLLNLSAPIRVYPMLVSKAMVFSPYITWGPPGATCEAIISSRDIPVRFWTAGIIRKSLESKYWDKSICAILEPGLNTAPVCSVMRGEFSVSVCKYNFPLPPETRRKTSCAAVNGSPDFSNPLTKSVNKEPRFSK